MTINWPTRYPNEFADGTSADSSRLDPQETTGPPPSGWSYRDFLTSGIPKQINQADAVYGALDNRSDTHRLAALRACRSLAWFVRHRVSGEIRIASSRCNLRWCPLCIKTKRFVMLQSLIPWVKNARKPKFLTLTLKHSPAPLADQVNALYGFFRTLRRRPFFKKRLIGGVWFFQITKSKTDGFWHPHLHIIAEGRYIDKRVLSSVWDEITHGSRIIDIKAVKNAKKASEYVARYATAPCDLSSLSLESALEVVESLHGRRICGTFGTALGLQLVPKRCPDSDDWEFMCGTHEVFYKRHHSDWHAEIYNAFISDRPSWAAPIPPPPDPGDLVASLQDSPITFKQFVFEWSSFYGGK